MAKRILSINFRKCMLEIGEDNSIWVIETNREGVSSYYNFTEEIKKIQNEPNINIKVSFDNEIESN